MTGTPPPEARPPLFTGRFFLMCGFSFTVFLSAFFLLPTMPFRILGLGGSTAAAGLFLGFLTYASAFSAPLTGSLADRLGRRRLLLTCSLVLACFAAAYAVTGSYRLVLALALLHGCFWSGLLSASAAHITDIIPESRRAEGIGYWGMATMAAIAVAPAIGFWLYDRGWIWLCTACAALNLGMAAIALNLREAPSAAPTTPERRVLVEWRVLVVSITLSLYSFGYGGLTSFTALYAEANGVGPRSLFFTVLAVVTIACRPLSVPLADRIGHRRVFLPSLGLIATGELMLALGGTRGHLLASALLFGIGFATAYPVFIAIVMKHVPPWRRGAAFGSVLAAFDTGIGTGSMATGWLIHHFGYRPAFAVGAVLAALSAPFFLLMEKRVLGVTPVE